MVKLDANGSPLTANLFIEAFDEAVKISPPRFMSLRLHPDRYKDIFEMASVPKSIQIGEVPGPVGKRLTKVQVVDPPKGVAHGVTIIQEPDRDPTTIQFDLHGNAALILFNIGEPNVTH